ncbi:hypothetical protein VV867_08725 [Pseudomonas sp. JH-2]|uniref:hypothetical protein n=1 Tax=Pseudomonas sp. JH-2 TaxID=3114998 RepID=UPI002E26E9AB|nr:hypothetical protein [Pseudomonas sp. JH-2]
MRAIIASSSFTEVAITPRVVKGNTRDAPPSHGACQPACHHCSKQAPARAVREILAWRRKEKAPKTCVFGAFMLEAEVGIEPAFTDLQSDRKIQQ